MWQAVLFDMDGVLLDSYTAWFHLVQMAAKDFGANDVTAEAFAKSWGQGVEADVETFFPMCTALEVAKFYENHFGEHLSHVKVFPDSGFVLTELKRRGIPTGVVTNTTPKLAAEILQYAKLKPSVLVGPSGQILPKPKPDIILRACELLGLKACEVVVVGDSRFDRDAAMSAGTFFVGYRDVAGQKKINDLKEILDFLELGAGSTTATHG